MIDKTHNEWPMPTLMPTSGTPDPDMLAQAVKDAKAFSMHHQINAATTKEQIRQVADNLEPILTILLNQIINLNDHLPTVPPLVVRLEHQATPKITIDSYQNLASLPGWTIDQETAGPMGLSLSITPLTMILSRYANEYRQSVAMQQLEDIVTAIDMGATKASKPRPIVIAARDLLPLKHPLKMLTDPTIVGQNFINHYQPLLFEGSPIHEWTKKNWLSSYLAINTAIPDSLATGLKGKPLASLISLPDSKANGQPIEDEIAQAYDGIIIDNIEPSQRRIRITFKPARQTCWHQHLLPQDHVAKNALEQALVNLGRTAEMV